MNNTSYITTHTTLQNILALCPFHVNFSLITLQAVIFIWPRVKERKTGKRERLRSNLSVSPLILIKESDWLNVANEKRGVLLLLTNAMRAIDALFYWIIPILFQLSLSTAEHTDQIHFASQILQRVWEQSNTVIARLRKLEADQAGSHLFVLRRVQFERIDAERHRGEHSVIKEDEVCSIQMKSWLSGH